MNDLQAAILIQTLFISESCGRKEKDVVSTISRQRIMAVLSNVNQVGYISRQYSQTLVTTLSYRNANNFSLSLSLRQFSRSVLFFSLAESIQRYFAPRNEYLDENAFEHFFVRILRKISRGDEI